MQVVYAPGGIRLLPTASTTYKDCIYWIHGEIGFGFPLPDNPRGNRQWEAKTDRQ